MKAELSKEAIPREKERLFEVLVFLFLIVPTMILSFFTIQQGMHLSFLFEPVQMVLAAIRKIDLIKHEWILE